VARRARAVDLAAIALTDHDTTDGVAEAAQEGARLGVRIIPGCEFSVRAPWGELHVLALFLPYAHEGLQTFLRDTRAARRRRGEQIVAKLQDLGVAIELEDVQAQLLGGDGGALGRPHVARALVDCGACDNISDAFRRYLGRGRAAYVEKPLPKLGEVTALVHDVGGLTVANDVSARDIQFQGMRDGGVVDLAPIQRSKTFPTFKPLGPAMVTPDEFSPPLDLAVTTRVNGELRQNGRTGEMLFSLPELIEAVSARIPLAPGDLILTGTPAGVGLASGAYLKPGDTVDVAAEGIGHLCNVVTSAAGGRQ